MGAGASTTRPIAAVLHAYNTQELPTSRSSGSPIWVESGGFSQLAIATTNRMKYHPRLVSTGHRQHRQGTTDLKPEHDLASPDLRSSVT